MQPAYQASHLETNGEILGVKRAVRNPASPSAFPEKKEIENVVSTCGLKVSPSFHHRWR